MKPTVVGKSDCSKHLGRSSKIESHILVLFKLWHMYIIETFFKELVTLKVSSASGSSP